MKTKMISNGAWVALITYAGMCKNLAEVHYYYGVPQFPTKASATDYIIREKVRRWASANGIEFKATAQP